MQNITRSCINTRASQNKFKRRHLILPKSLLFTLLPIALAGTWIGACHAPDKTGVHMAKAAQSNSKPEAAPARKKIVFFGNSITAGYGLSPAEAFPALIQRRIDSLRLPYVVINAGVSGETSADGLSRIDWILKEPLSIFILELGGNDALRGLPLTETYRNLDSIVRKVKSRYPDVSVILAGMQAPPNIGTDYTNRFRKLFPELAKKDSLILIPFLLEGVGGIPSLNQPDGIHPTAEGDRMVAGNVWNVLRDLVQPAKR